MAAESVDFAAPTDVKPAASSERNHAEKTVSATAPSAETGRADARRAAPQAATCPFCALLCDDLEVRREPDGAVSVLRNGCRRADTDFARTPLAPEPLVDGRRGTLEEAVAVAAKLLRRARQPLIDGLGTDVDGARAAVRLAGRCGATLDHVHGESLADGAALLQSRGHYATTLSEVHNRADFVLLVGVDLEDRYENLARRCLRPATALDPKRLGARRIVSLGTPNAVADTSLRCRPQNLPVVLNGLLAELRGRPLTARSVGGVPRRALAALAAGLRESRYSVVAFATGPLGAMRPAVLQTVADLVSELNTESRAAALPLGGDDGAQSAAGVCTWMTGYPLRVRCGKTLDYDPHANAGERLVAGGAADALLWVDAFGRHANPPRGARPEQTVILSAVRPTAARRAAAWIPVGTPGLDHAARLLRTDAVVTLPLPALRDAGLPSVATVLGAISAAL